MRAKPALLLQLGLGRVGRALVAHYLAHGDRYPALRYVGVGDSSGLWLMPDGWDAAALGDAATFKGSGMPLTRWHPDSTRAEAVPAPDAYAPDLLWRLDELGVRRAIVVDATPPGSDTTPLLIELHRAGYDVVLANRAPLAGSQRDYDALTKAGKGRVRANAALGAALPLADALRHQCGGEPIQTIVAALDPALNWIVAAVQDGVRFSAAVEEAGRRDLLHRDWCEDLSGATSARLALLLARLSGYKGEPEAVCREALLPFGWEGQAAGAAWARLGELDSVLAEQVWLAGERGQVLRYLAQAAPGRVSAGLEALSAGGPFGRLEADSSLTALYRAGDARPTLLGGPSATAATTAAAIFADVVSLL
ncbi:MAG: hypothetical protein M3Z04_12585 [Chloroflexota bacterium]|nr:hypothetical protein [Chloroflexota bacterium]